MKNKIRDYIISRLKNYDVEKSDYDMNLLETGLSSFGLICLVEDVISHFNINTDKIYYLKEVYSVNNMAMFIEKLIGAKGSGDY
jgi:acyl carrier protein